jgi:hypothetical protein
MAHFAEVINGKVKRVLYLDNDIVTDENGVEQESLGQAHLNQHNPTEGTWIQTSYNHNIRNVYAGEGYDYNSTEDKFYPPKPHASWVWGTDSANLKTWLPPIDFPTNSIPGASLGDPDPITGIREWNDVALQNPESWDETRQTFVSTNVDSNQVVYVWNKDTLVWENA